ncbi:MAG: hypothetical protein NVSMB56_00450 [Pyrinomonadaceae bacterium]
MMTATEQVSSSLKLAQTVSLDEGSTWFGNAQLQAFIEELIIFPIPKRKSIQVVGGFYKKDGTGEIDQEHLAISVYPIDSRGHLGVQVRIATELWKDQRPESQQAVKLEIITSYEPLMQFSRKLKALMDGRIEEVILDSELLS